MPTECFDAVRDNVAQARIAEQRVRSVAQVFDSLTLITGPALEAQNLARFAQLAAQVLEEGCEVMAVMQQRLVPPVT